MDELKQKDLEIQRLRAALIEQISRTRQLQADSCLWKAKDRQYEKFDTTIHNYQLTSSCFDMINLKADFTFKDLDEAKAFLDEYCDPILPYKEL